MKRIGLLDWCERHVTLWNGPFKRTDWPGAIGPARWCEYRRGFTVIVLGAAQAFKTVLSVLVNLYWLATAGSDSGFYGSTDENIADTIQTKFQPRFEGVDILQRVCISDKSTGQKRFPGVLFQFLSAAKAGDRAGKTHRKQTADEAHIYKSKQFGEIEDRTSGFEGLDLWLVTSTGGERVTEFTEKCDNATVYEFSPPCDKCKEPMDYRFFTRKPVTLKEAESKGLRGEVVELDGKELFRPFGGLRFDKSDKIWNKSGRLNEKVFNKTVFYECPHCGHHHEFSETTRNERNWRAVETFVKKHGWKFRVWGFPDSWYGYEKIRDGLQDTVVFHYSGLYQKNWLKLARTFVLAHRARSRGDHSLIIKFYKTELGINYSRSLDEIGGFGIDVNKGGYQMVNPSEKFDLAMWWPDADPAKTILIGTVDVGDSHYWAVFRAWTLKGHLLYSRQMWAGMLYSQVQIKTFQENFGIPDHGGRIFRNPRTGGVAIGKPGCGIFLDGNYDRLSMVRAAAAENHWIVYRGRNKDNKMFRDEFKRNGVNYLYDKLRLVAPFENTIHQGRKIKPAVEMYFASARCESILEDIREVHEPEVVWTYATDAPEDYLKHLGSRKRFYNERGLEEFNQTTPEDHCRDCEKMQIGVLSMAGLLGDGETLLETGVSLPEKAA